MSALLPPRDALSSPSATAADPTSLLVALPEARLCVAALVAVGSLTACHVLGVPVRSADVVGGAAVLLGALVLPPRWALLLAITAWAWLTGFVVHADGVLTLHAADVARLAAVAAVGAGASSAGAAWRGRGRGRGRGHVTDRCDH